MKIIAIDPGYDRVGIAILEKNNSEEKIIFSECFETSKKDPLSKRLGSVGVRVRELIQKHNTQVLVIEDLFFAKNTKTALKVSEARGVIMFQAFDVGIPIYEYTPNQIKVAITGYGNAHKNDMYIMIQKLITLEERKYIDDEIDAIGVGLTFFARERFDLL